VLDALGSSNAGVEWAVRISAVAIAIAGSTVLFAVMFAGLCGTGVPRRDLLRGSGLAAGGFEMLKVFATLLLGHTMRNPVYATFSVAIGLLVWINFVSQLTLFAGAWTATFDPDLTRRHGGQLSGRRRAGGTGVARAPGG
jgi:membrane protein